MHKLEDTTGVIIVVHWRKTDNKMAKIKWDKNETQWTAKYNTEADATPMLLHINRKFTMGKLKSIRLDRNQLSLLIYMCTSMYDVIPLYICGVQQNKYEINNYLYTYPNVETYCYHLTKLSSLSNGCIVLIIIGRPLMHFL